jgi:integrase
MQNYKNLKAFDAAGDLAKAWYVSYYFLHPTEGKFVRFRETGDINRIDSVTARREALFQLKQARLVLLQSGWSPFQQYDPETFLVKSGLCSITINEAFDRVLAKKKLLLAPASYSSFRSHVESFRSYFTLRNLTEMDVRSLTQKYVLDFLDERTASGSVSLRTRNNLLIDIKSMFSTLVDGEVIDTNPAMRIKKISCASTKNALFNETQLSQMFEWMDSNNPYLGLYCRFIAYTFIRPIELTRLKVKDIDMVKKVIHLSEGQTKNKTGAVIPIIKSLEDELLKLKLDEYPKDYYLFSAKGCPAARPTTRDFFTDKFSVLKKAMGLGSEFTMYGLKHTFVCQLLRNGAREVDVRRVTRHKTAEAFYVYIRQFNLERPNDLSQFYLTNY